ncbi:Suppressor of SWI4 1 homolog [Geodia barretti]|uniref:Suppressor of SWI4 1 homolog n=1 Tax=Geodia barretti TaxID=519541 RepID=A0AA35XEW5_GEOBA|nr:Suppressor of SWI4 1 homolog [Geodia barretti]
MGRTRRTKKRSHVVQEGQEEKPTPNTFVMERGRVGRTLGQLVRDLRRVMEPHTASKLKVRQRNVLMDFVNVAGPLGVSHFLILSRSQTHVNLRICRLPRGPTVTFHITGFSLTRDVISSVRKTATSLTQYMTAPLLILNNFSSEDKSSKLMAAMLQSMLPSLNVQTVKLANINRCVLFNYNTDDKMIELRHYSIRAVARGISRAVKRLGKASVPNLSRYQDISEYMLGGNVSESEGEEVAGQEVTLPQNLRGRGNLKSTQSSVRLIELGPRLTLQLVKVEAGMCKGEVLHHEFIQKTKREARDVRRRVEDREKLRSQRRRQQEENVTRKKRETELHKLDHHAWL